MKSSFVFKQKLTGPRDSLHVASAALTTTLELNMPKKVDLTVSITLPEDHGGGRLKINPEGDIRMVNSDGIEIVPTSIERTTHYERVKGQKVQSPET